MMWNNFSLVVLLADNRVSCGFVPMGHSVVGESGRQVNILVTYVSYVSCSRFFFVALMLRSIIMVHLLKYYRLRTVDLCDRSEVLYGGEGADFLVRVAT